MKKESKYQAVVSFLKKVSNQENFQQVAGFPYPSTEPRLPL